MSKPPTSSGKAPTAPSTAKKGKKKGEEDVPEVLNGTGTFLYSETCKYVGEWHMFDGVKKKHGQGTYTDLNNSYTGEFDQDDIQGTGVMTFASGSKYSGTFVKNKFDGEGCYTWADGSSYSGLWRDNKMHGHGAYTSKDGKKWVGEFFNGCAEGLDRELTEL